MPAGGQYDVIFKIIGALAALAGVIAGLVRLLRGADAWWDRRTLRQRLGAERYDREEILRATAHYIAPDCQSVDPSGGEDFRRIVSTREPLFSATDRLLTNPGQYKFLILLADSGMGKTSFFLNYYARHRRHWTERKRFRLALVPLNRPEADQWISEISEKPDTVLFLDALDEDRIAIEDHRRRIGELVAITNDFKAVVITCRSQFFPKDEEIPVETGVLKTGAVGLGDPGVHYFHKLYLSPFTDAQVERYLKRRFPLHRYRQRRQAREIVARIRDLVARPMLLANVQDLVKTGRSIDWSFQLYEEMVDAWLEREKRFVKDKKTLREFSELAAVDMFLNREQRGMERIPEADLEPLARKYDIPLKDWQLRGRSLLNRDAAGNYKFAHRSIMEYLFAKRFADGKVTVGARRWTDQIQSFVLEMWRQGRVCLQQADLSGTDLSGIDLRAADLGGANLRGAFLVGSTDGLKYVWIAPGDFLMGAVSGDQEASDDEKPQHPVTITKGFWLSTGPVTVAAYKRFVREAGGTMPQAPRFNPGWRKENHPIVRVSWHDAVAYCEWAGGRLPTEAQWEYAARGGEEGLKYPWGDRFSPENANYGGSKWNATSPAGSYPANGFGLHDMAGNVWEWVTDVYAGDYYKRSPREDPRGPSTGDLRVFRGGSWDYNATRILRASARGRVRPGYRRNSRGFRCAREVFP